MESRIEEDFESAKEKVLSAETNLAQEQESKVKSIMSKFSGSFKKVETMAKTIITDAGQLKDDAMHLNIKGIISDVQHLEHDLEGLVTEIKSDSKDLEQTTEQAIEDEVNEFKGDAQKVVLEVQKGVREVQEIPVNGYGTGPTIS